MRRSIVPVLVLVVLALFLWSQQRASPPAPSIESSLPAATRPAASPADASKDGLPPEVAETRSLIQRGGPFPHRQDGAVFENRERELPSKPRGYYREYTVETPGASDRGSRRIITGGDPPSVFYYTDDHYRSFLTLEPAQ